MHTLEYHAQWLNHDGARVLIDGHAHTLRVRTYTARYPREYEAISVYAEPCNRSAKWYQEERRRLGDDWTTDVLASDVELQAEILRQLEQ